MSISGKLYEWNERAKYAPENPGVYIFFDKNIKIIYIGGSNNIRKTFINYLKANFAGDPKKRETKYYKREITTQWKDRLKNLLENNKKKCGENFKLNILTKKNLASAYKAGFHFYEDFGKPISISAYNLKEFEEKIKIIPISSLEFHQNRGDFSRWIREIIKKKDIAEKIEKIESKGEKLRNELIRSLSNSIILKCEKCNTENKPIKTWKLAGNPSKNGIQNRLTIGYFKCSNCGNSFRKVIKKEKINLVNSK
jgi:hypothetical protein